MDDIDVSDYVGPHSDIACKHGHLLTSFAIQSRMQSNFEILIPPQTDIRQCILTALMLSS